MGLAGGEGDGGGADVAGFDADHVRPFFIAEIGHRLGFGDPGIPDDRGGGIFLGDGDRAGFDGVVDGDGAGGVEVDAVGLSGNGDVATLVFLLHVVGLIDIGDGIETGDAGLADVADGEVGVLCFFGGKGRGTGIGQFDGHDELGAEGDVVAEEKVVGPHCLGGIVAFGGEGDSDCGAILLNGVEFPFGEAGEAVGGGLRVVLVGPEPGKAERHAAADGLVVFPHTFVAEPEHFFAHAAIDSGSHAATSAP